LFCTTVEDSHLTSDNVSDFKQLLLDHEATFAKSSDDLGFCPLLQNDIDTGDAKPIRQPPRRPPLASGRAEDDLVDEIIIIIIIIIISIFYSAIRSGWTENEATKMFSV